jgi:hypothetical protein
MRVTVPFPLSLSDVAEFMSLAAPGLTSDQWDEWCRKRRDWLRLEKGEPLRMTIEEAKRLYEELHRDLTRMRLPRELTERRGPEGNPLLHEPERNPFANVLVKLNELQLQFRWTARKEKKGSTHGFNFGEERWLIQSWPGTDDKRQAFYFVLGEALRNGSIATLKVCAWLECRKYYVAKDPRQEFCATECRNRFNNLRKAQGGKFREYREARRKRDIIKATRLIKKELSFKEMPSRQQVQKVKVETGLPRKVIDELVEKANS